MTPARDREYDVRNTHLPKTVFPAPLNGESAASNVLTVSEPSLASVVCRERRVPSGATAGGQFASGFYFFIIAIIASRRALNSVPGFHSGHDAESATRRPTTNRNFYGRMGHPSAEVYLANPAVAAASAVAGKVADPRDL